MSALRDSVRARFVELTGLSDKVADFEKGILNWCLRYADAHRVSRSWSNPHFSAIYKSKARSLLLNLDPSSYVNNVTLVKRLAAGEVHACDLAVMKPHDLFPERWRDVIELKEQRDEYASSVKPVAMTNQFRCNRCKKRECVYQELQLRSADEPASIIVTCISCNHTWRVG